MKILLRNFHYILTGEAGSNLSPVLEVLDRPLVLLRRLTRRERPQVLALPRLLIGMTAIDTKFTGFELTNHAYLRCRVPHPLQLHRNHESEGPDLSRAVTNPTAGCPTFATAGVPGEHRGPRRTCSFGVGACSRGWGFTVANVGFALPKAE